MTLHDPFASAISSEGHVKLDIINIASMIFKAELLALFTAAIVCNTTYRMLDAEQGVHRARV